MKVVFSLICTTNACGNAEIGAARDIFQTGVAPDKVDEEKEKLGNYLKKLPKHIEKLNEYVFVNRPPGGRRQSFEKITHYRMEESGRDIFTGLAEINGALLPQIDIDGLIVRNLVDPQMEINHLFMRFFLYCKAVKDGEIDVEDDQELTPMPYPKHGLPWLTWTIIPIDDAVEETAFGMVGMAGSGAC